MKRILLLLALVLTATPMTAIAQQGTMNNIVIFIRFSDDTSEIGTPFSTIDNMLNDSSATSTSMYSYFKQVSYNKLTVISHFFPAPSGNTVISYQDIYPHTYYEPYNSTIAPNGYQTSTERWSREYGLMERAVNWVNANSPVPSTLNLDMDNDGNVDNVVFIVKGGLLRDLNGGTFDLFWPHKSSIDDRMVYMGGKRVYNYNVMFEGSGSMYFNTKVFCHEFFHTLGAPDLENASSNSTVPYVAWWDLMGNGSGHMSAYMKWKYGHWIDSIPTITQPGTYTLHSLGDDSCYNNCYKIASQDPHQWYVLEYRDSTERFETNIHGKGLLIYRIDDRYTGNAGRGVEVYLFRPNASDVNTVGTIMEAWFSGDTPRSSFTSQTNPHPWLTGGIPDTSFAIVDISVPDSTISFTYLPVCITPHDLTVSGITDTSALLSWSAPSDSVLLQWHATGSSDLNFVVLGGQSFLLDTLIPSTGYEWRVKSICGAGDSSWFTPWDTFFTTQCLLHETTIGTGGTTSNSFPFNTWYKYSYTQMLYTAAEIGEARQITTLAFNYSNGWNPLVNKDSCVIYLGTTTDTAFIDQMDSYKPFNLLHKVYEGPIDCVYGWNNIELDRPFYYNGTETLIVAIDDNSGTENFYYDRFYCNNTPGRYTSVTCFDDNINFDPAGNFFPYRQAFQTRADIRFIGCSLSEMPRFDVTVSSSDSLQGSVTGGGTYDIYTLVTVTAIPETNYHFVYWLSGGDTITANPYTFSVTADSTLVACFAIDSFSLSLNAIGEGTVSGDGMYAIGSTATITATASDNHHFLYWTCIEDTITDNPYTLILTSDTNFTAHFAVDSHYVAVAPSDSTMGFAYIYSLNGEMFHSAIFPHGSLVDVYAGPNPYLEGYNCSFLQWSDGDTNSHRIIELTQDTMLLALFDAQPLEGISTATNPFKTVVQDGGIEVFGAAGQAVALCDVIGRCLWNSVASERQFIPVGRPGVYVLRIGNQAVRKIVIR